MSQPPLRSDIPSYPHVEIHDDGVPYIAGTTMKIVELVDSKEAYGWSPEELHFQFPQLTLGMVYGALAYYWDHQEEVDSDRELRLRLAEEYRLQDGPSPLAAKIRALGLKT
ncbi:MAG: DUF433 domain-containing protein [Acidobacteriota bacterium]